MAQFLGFGNGSDGSVTLSGTYAPIDSSCSGTSGATSLTATNASFAAGQFIIIHQSRGTGVGQWEINRISSYTAGTITTTRALSYTYIDSGASQAQVIVMPEYSDITVSGTLTTKAWNGDVGGIIPLMCNGNTIVSGTITANGGDGTSTTAGSGGGFRGGARVVGSNANQYSGEGSAGASAVQHTANGSGGGGGQNGPSPNSTGGGGGNSASGSDGYEYWGGTEYGHTAICGDGGSETGSADLTSMTFGGGGGGGSAISDGSPGGAGGGIILIFSKNIEVSGSITADGGAAYGFRAGDTGGSGAGGSIFLKSVSTITGSGLVTADKGAQAWGANGADGRIRIESCSISGTTSPSASESEGGHSYCGGSAFIF